MPSLSNPLFACALLLAAAPAGAELIEDTVATVNGQPILRTEYAKNLESVMEQYRRTAPMILNEKETVAQIRRKVLDQMVDDKLMEAEAVRRKIKVHEREVDAGINEVKERNFRRDLDGRQLSDEEIEKALNAELQKEGLTPAQFRERIRKQIMIRRVIEEVVKPRVKPPEEADVRKAFDKMKFIIKGDTSVVSGLPEEDAQAFLALGQRVKDLTSERVRVSHILFKIPPNTSLVEKKKILDNVKSIKKKVDEGEDFSELAHKHSDDKESAGRGGDMGFILKGWMPAEFEKVAFSLPVGDTSEPVETQFGVHIIRVQEKKAAESVSFDKIKDDVAQFLFNLDFQKELDKMARGLRAQAQIEIRLPKDN